jgi:hypothetical protein
MKGRPAQEREDRAYLAGMTETLAWLTPEEHGWLTHPRTGLHTVCKFLPTPADVHEFLRERQARTDAFVPTPTTYKRLNGPEHDPRRLKTPEERASFVSKVLGYNPMERA